MKELNVEKYKNSTKMSYLREEQKEDWMTVAESIRGMESTVQDTSSNFTSELKELEFKLDGRITKTRKEMKELNDSLRKDLNLKIDTAIDVIGSEVKKVSNMVKIALALGGLAILLSLIF